MDLINRNKVIDFSAILGSRLGGVFVTLFFIPFYFNKMGSEGFGVVAVILSLQSLLLMLDFGVSTIVSRDIASLRIHAKQSISIWRSAEFFLITAYFVAAIPVILYADIVGIGGLSIFLVIEILILFLVCVLQNICQIILISAKHYRFASGLQFFGNLGRAGFTAIAIDYFDPSIFTFINAQLVFGIMFLLISRNIGIKFFQPNGARRSVMRSIIPRCIRLAKKSKSLMLFSLAGAAVMQLDKPIIAKFISVGDVSAYYLAVTFCMIPISFFAAPISQYYQPHIFREWANGNAQKIEKTLKQYVFFLVTTVAILALVLWQNRIYFIEIWLKTSGADNTVISYVEILLPAVAVGALGYVPFIMLTAEEDYRFQSIFSTILSVTTLLLVVYFSISKNIYGVCWIYACYHVLATAISWGRSCFLSTLQPYALLSLKYTGKLLLIISIACIFYKIL
jgi:O-antigen/teichoic acid export membrane protein